MAAQRQELEAIAARAGRDPATLDIALLRPMHILDRPAGGSRQALIGTPEQVAEDIHAYAQVGVSHLVLGFRTTDGQEVLQQVERFAAEVRPRLL